MRKLITTLLMLSAVGGAALGQILPLQHGDLVLTYCKSQPPNSGAALAVRPATQQSTILAQAPTLLGFAEARMDALNARLVTATWNGTGPQRNHLMWIGPGGGLAKMTTLPGNNTPQGFDLDHDGWVIGGNTDQSATSHFDYVWRLQSNSFTNIFQRQRPKPSFKDHELWDVAIDGDPGAPSYVLAFYHRNVSTIATARLLGIDRRGVVTTIIYAGTGDPLRSLCDVELDPATGHYLVCSTSQRPSNVPVCLVSKTGAVSTVLTTSSILGPYAAKLNQDGTAWVFGWTPTYQTAVFKVSIAGKSILATIPVPFTSNNVGTGIEVYGSRQLVCNGSGKPGTTVNVRLQSRKPGDAGMFYALACSPGRRPGIRFPHGEWLHLDVTHPLFLATAANLAPSVFQCFQGVTNAKGNAYAQANIPAGFPSGTGMTIFVAGVIYGPGGVQTVTNTHWFVL